MTAPVVLTFTRPVEAVTANSRDHWTKRRRLLVPWCHALRVAWALAGSPAGLPPSTVAVVFGVPDRRRRDPSNLMPTQKALVDELVRLGVWPDDNGDWVTEQMPTLAVGTDQVTVTLTPR